MVEKLCGNGLLNKIFVFIIWKNSTNLWYMAPLHIWECGFLSLTFMPPTSKKLFNIHPLFMCFQQNCQHFSRLFFLRCLKMLKHRNSVRRCSFITIKTFWVNSIIFIFFSLNINAFFLSLISVWKQICFRAEQWVDCT